jgi:hypothetical protein
VCGNLDGNENIIYGVVASDAYQAIVFGMFSEKKVDA